MSVRKILPVIILFFFLSLDARAGEWNIVGPKALGMGGAAVAVADDATASYWNPAAFGFFYTGPANELGKRPVRINTGAGAAVVLHEDIGEEINKILSFDYTALGAGQISATQVADFLQLVDELKTFSDNPARAVTVRADAVLAFQYGHFGLAGYLLGDLSGRGDIDLVNIVPVSSGLSGINLITQLSTTQNFNSGSAVPAGDFYFTPAEKQSLINTISAMSGWDTTTATNYVQAVDYGLSQAQSAGKTIPSDITVDVTDVAQLAADAGTGGSFADNASRLLFKGRALLEVPFTYGVAITDNIAVGANVKYMRARVYNTSVKVFNTDLTDAIDTAKNDYEESQNFGVDLGVLFRMGETFRFGVVARNINSPQFDMKRLLADDKDHLTEEKQIRAGLAFRPVSFLTLALDADLTKNPTNIASGYKSQNIGGGLEIDILRSLRLRAGAYKNIAETDIGVVYTAGLGLNLEVFRFDVGAALSSESSSIDSNDIPKVTRVEAQFSLVF